MAEQSEQNNANRSIFLFKLRILMIAALVTIAIFLKTIRVVIFLIQGIVPSYEVPVLQYNFL